MRDDVRIDDLYGLMAEFATPEALLAAARRAHEDGYRKMDAYSPMPVSGMAKALGRGPTRMPRLVLAGGLFGMLSGYGLQYYVSVVSYPVDVGGRPLHSWPAFIPVTFELTILSAAIFAVVGMFLRNGFPQPYHPVFNVRRFALASRDRFFLCIEAADAHFEPEATRRFLESLDPAGVYPVAS